MHAHHVLHPFPFSPPHLPQPPHLDASLLHTHTSFPTSTLYPHTHLSPLLLLIITYTAGTLHFISSILSLQGWQAGHKLSWRWGWKLEEIVMKISSVCRSGRSCSCHTAVCWRNYTGSACVCVCACVCVFVSLCIMRQVREHMWTFAVRVCTALTHAGLCASPHLSPCACACSCVCRWAGVYRGLAR